MSLGESTFAVTSGGGTQKVSAAQLSKAVVQLGVSPLGSENTLIAIADPTSIPGALGSGPLAEAVAARMRGGQTAYAMPITPSTAGAAGVVTQVGTGSGAIAVSLAPHLPVKILCVTGGAIGTATFQFSTDNGVTYGPVVASVGSAPWVYRVPGTFLSISFAAATYVSTKVYTFGVDGTATAGSGWVGTLTPTSSPVDMYEVVATVVKAGALGAAVLSVSLDNGNSTIPNMLIPSGGVLPIPGTGIVMTCSSTFVAGETYSFLTVPPSFSTSDLTTAMTALRALRTFQATMIHVAALPASAAGAISMASTLETALETAFNSDGLDWCGMVECPTSDKSQDIVLYSGAAIRDTADTVSVIQAARGADLNRTAVNVGTYRVTSPLTGRKALRPLGVALACRYVDTEPREDLSALRPYGALPIFVPGSGTFGHDEDVTPGIDDVQMNSARSYRGKNGVFLSITSGGSGFKNMTTDAAWQDAGLVRIVNTAVAQLRPVAMDLLGQRPLVNLDGTIAESAARAWDTLLDSAFKRATGLLKGGDFTSPQVSLATASVLRSSQLGQSPKRLDIAYQVQGLGFVSSVSNRLLFSGVLSITQ